LTLKPAAALCPPRLRKSSSNCRNSLIISISGIDLAEPFAILSSTFKTN